MSFIFLPNPLLDFQLRTVSAKDTYDAALKILAAAQALCPIGETGELYDSLHAEKGPVGISYVIAGTDHWIFPEFGSWNYGPEPYLRPALDSVKL